MIEEKPKNILRPFFIEAVDYDKELHPVSINSEDVVGIRPTRNTEGHTVLLVNSLERRAIVHAPYDRVRALFAENGYQFLSVKPR